MLATQVPGGNAPAERFYRPELDGLRFVGVDLFFALSAYLITELLLRERAERGTLNVRAFYKLGS